MATYVQKPTHNIEALTSNIEKRKSDRKGCLIGLGLSTAGLIANATLTFNSISNTEGDISPFTIVTGCLSVLFTAGAASYSHGVYKESKEIKELQEKIDFPFYDNTYSN